MQEKQAIKKVFKMLGYSENLFLLEDLDGEDYGGYSNNKLTILFGEKLEGYNEEQYEEIKMRLHNFLVEELRKKSFLELYNLMEREF